MKRYQKYKESNNMNSKKFILTLNNSVEEKYTLIKYDYFIAEYNPQIEEISSKYSKIESKKINLNFKNINKLVIYILNELSLSISLSYTVENGFIVIRAYSKNGGLLPIKPYDKHWKNVISNNEILQQDLIVLTVQKIKFIEEDDII